MKLLSQNFKKGFVKILVETQDDLWTLSHVIEQGDLVKGKTVRKIKATETADAVKKAVFLSITVEKLDYKKDVLRIAGKVTEEQEDVQKGSYHTFDAETKSVITITKKEWLSYQIDKIKEASKAKIPKILICVFDREEAFFALMKRSGYELLTHIQGDVVKKRVEEKQQKKNFYQAVIEQMESYDERYKLDKIILASPAFWKEELFKTLTNQELKKKIIQATCSTADETAVNEVLKRPETREALQQERIAKELEIVEEILKAIAKKQPVAYGIKEVKQAAEAGAVKTLAVTDEMIEKHREAGKFSELDALMKTVDRMKGSIVIVSSEHDGGKKLDGLGGIAALLRFSLR